MSNPKTETKTETPATSLRGFNLRWTKRIYGYAGGEVVSKNALERARHDYEYGEGILYKESLLPGCVYQIQTHLKADLILDGEYFKFDSESKTLTMIGKIVKLYGVTRDFPGFYTFR